MSIASAPTTLMGKHSVDAELVPTGTTYGPAFPLMMLLGLAITETIALLTPSCSSMGFCG